MITNTQPRRASSFQMAKKRSSRPPQQPNPDDGRNPSYRVSPQTLRLGDLTYEEVFKLHQSSEILLDEIRQAIEKFGKCTVKKLTLDGYTQLSQAEDLLRKFKGRFVQAVGDIVRHETVNQQVPKLP